jgi:hypothetical protein
MNLRPSLVTAQHGYAQDTALLEVSVVGAIDTVGAPRAYV